MILFYHFWLYCDHRMIFRPNPGHIHGSHYRIDISTHRLVVAVDWLLKWLQHGCRHGMVKNGRRNIIEMPMTQRDLEILYDGHRWAQSGLNLPTAGIFFAVLKNVFRQHENDRWSTPHSCVTDFLRGGGRFCMHVLYSVMLLW